MMSSTAGYPACHVIAGTQLSIGVVNSIARLLNYAYKYYPAFFRNSHFAYILLTTPSCMHIMTTLYRYANTIVIVNTVLKQLCLIFCVAPAEESSHDDNEVQVTQEVHVVASYTMYVVTM